MHRSLGYFLALLIAVSTVGQLTSGQPTVDTDVINEGCSNNGEYTSLFRELLAGQKRLEAQLRQQQGSSAEPYTGHEPRESQCVYVLTYLLILISKFTEATNVTHTDGISRHRLSPYTVYYRYIANITLYLCFRFQL